MARAITQEKREQEIRKRKVNPKQLRLIMLAMPVGIQLEQVQVLEELELLEDLALVEF